MWRLSCVVFALRLVSPYRLGFSILTPLVVWSAPCPSWATLPSVPRGGPLLRIGLNPFCLVLGRGWDLLKTCLAVLSVAEEGHARGKGPSFRCHVPSFSPRSKGQVQRVSSETETPQGIYYACYMVRSFILKVRLQWSVSHVFRHVFCFH